MAEQTMLHGIVKNGVIVPDDGVRLPEGAQVKFVVQSLEFTPEERAEFEAWEQLSDEAWEQIDWGDEEDSNAAG
jgi:hypothetical protein